MPLATVNQLEESQSHRTDQGSSDYAKVLYFHATGEKRRNPTVQIRAFPTGALLEGPHLDREVAIPLYRSGLSRLGLLLDATAMATSRNPTAQIRAFSDRANRPTNPGGHGGRNPTVQIRALLTLRLGFPLAIRLHRAVAIPTHRSGRFRRSAPPAAKMNVRSRNPTIQSRAFPLLVGFRLRWHSRFAAIPPTDQGVSDTAFCLSAHRFKVESQSHRTDQGSSDDMGLYVKVTADYEKSQSHRTDEGSGTKSTQRHSERSEESGRGARFDRRR